MASENVVSFSQPQTRDFALELENLSGQPAGEDVEPMLNETDGSITKWYCSLVGVYLQKANRFSLGS
jgi:hypothetical protein